MRITSTNIEISIFKEFAIYVYDDLSSLTVPEVYTLQNDCQSNDTPVAMARLDCQEVIAGDLMMRVKLTSLLLTGLMIGSIAPSLSGQTNSNQPAKCQSMLDEQSNAQDLSAQWLALRHEPGHFSGGSWSAELDGFNGRKHCLMLALEQALHPLPSSTGQALRWLGQPDAILGPNEGQDHLIPHTIRAAHADQLWLYEWRGSHDQLVLAVQNDHIVLTDWALAHE